MSKDNEPLFWVFNSKFLRVIGILGYSMYLVHYFVLEFLLRNGLQDKLEVLLLTFTITFIISCFTYIFIEKPFLRLAKFLLNK
ncbi:hypothetical protein EL23_08960 [Paenibacillus polymyxa]|nr:hypothetical protein EL23_08960 [Paenibacillus polymyxa]